MKNLKKILAVICVLALVCVGVVLTAIAEDAYTGTVEEFEAKIAAIAAARLGLIFGSASPFASDTVNASAASPTPSRRLFRKN